MMRTLVLVCALLFVVGGVCTAATFQYDLYEGWNQVSAPLVPFNPDPGVVFAEHPQGPLTNLNRWDSTYGGYNYNEDELDAFGKILLGDGYQVFCSPGTVATTIHFTGVPDGVPDMAGDPPAPVPNTMTDMWISLPGSTVDHTGAWHLIGQPFAHNTPVNAPGSNLGENVKFTNGTLLLTWSEASNPPYAWVSPEMSGWDAVYGGTTVRYDGDGWYDYLTAGQAYWVMTYQPDLAMIVMAAPVL